MPLPALDRALEILELLADEAEGLPLTRIGERLGLPKSATHRLLAALAERGHVAQDEATQRYHLTLKFATLGFRFLSATRLTEVCQPVLDRLAAETGELVRLALVDGSAMTWVAKAQGARAGLRYDPDTGHGVILHATASGKAWLATLDEDAAVAIVTRTGFGAPSRFGPRAVRGETALRQQLRETRRRGWGVAVEEGEPGTAAVACVVRASVHPDAAVVGTVSVAGPVVRMTPSRRIELAGRLAKGAVELAQLWPMRRQVEAGRLATVDA